MLIGQLLLERGVVSAEQLNEGLRLQKESGDFLCAAIAKLGFVPEDKIFNALSSQLNVPYADLKNEEIPQEAILKLPANLAMRYGVMPVDFRDNVLTVAMADPLDMRSRDELKIILGVQVRPALSSERQITDAMRRYYGLGADTLESIVQDSSFTFEGAEDTENIEHIETLALDASIVKFVNQILSEAIKERATDIHLEPYGDELRVRFRIDGVLYTVNTPKSMRRFHSAIVSRIKIMSQLNIAERRLPQDGRIKIKVSDDELDLRVSILPTAFKEAVHIRLLSPRFFLQLGNLGLNGDSLDFVRNVIVKPHGIVFVTGPTGSGKSTTLYAALDSINTASIKILTIEDPIEYQLKGINQLQVNPKIGFTFAQGLRHMLRHDPDVMMVGEVRDYETAEIAIRAALTGHLVFSTLHTNDAAGAVTRLLDMGVEPFLLSSSLECVIAQRLVRLVCPYCKVKVNPRDEVVSELGKYGIDIAKAEFFEGQGCGQCRYSGYRGRTGIYEILPLASDIRDLIINRASSQSIRKKAMASGMRALRQDGLLKAAEGITTVSEVIRVTQQEDFSEE